jgi:hypothetical protein
MKINAFIQALLLGKVLGQYTLTPTLNNLVATGSILETEWYGDEASDSSRI